MKKITRKLILYMLVWVPISAVSFAAKAALSMDLQPSSTAQLPDDLHARGPHESI